MAEPNISLLGASYSGVKGVTLPKQGGGTATFPWVEGSETKTANGTYDVTNLAQLVVNVSGGGGGGATLVATKEYTISTTSTTATSVGSFTPGVGIWNTTDIIYVKIRDKAGPRSDYYYGSDNFFINYQVASNSTSAVQTPARVGYYFNSSGTYKPTTGGYGVYAYELDKNSKITIYRRYNSSYSHTINGTFKVEVYKIPMSGLFGTPSS